VLLSNKLLETEKTLKTIQEKLSHEDTSSGFPNVGPATRELVHVLKAAHKTILKDYSAMTDGRNHLLDKVEP
jgi:hypothetical protein